MICINQSTVTAMCDIQPQCEGDCCSSFLHCSSGSNEHTHDTCVSKYIEVTHLSAVLWLRQLVAGLSLQRPGFDRKSVHVGYMVDKVALGQVFPPSTSVFPCQFHSTGVPLHGKMKKLIIFIIAAQQASRLQCIHSMCCGALHRKKKTSVYS
jgi:hypothetical protein